MSLWIDFDRSGTFDDDESVVVPLANNATSATLTWDNSGSFTIPGDITSGTTYARFRLSTDYNDIDDRTSLAANSSLLDAVAGNGEVEDYKIIIEGGIDYGDAPDNAAGTVVGDYETTDKTGTGDDGASHTITSGLSIGSSVDEDDGSLQNTDANADDNNGSDDEDGVTFVDRTVINKNVSDNE